MAQANTASALANIYQDAGAVAEDHVHVHLPGDLPGGIARRGARRGRAGDDGLLQEPEQGGGGLLGLYDLFVGGNLSRATIFALGIMPYISASIFAQIAGAVIPTVDKMQKDEEGRKKITQWTRYATVALAMVQAWGFALFTECVQGAVASPGFGFKLEMAFFLTTGAMFVMWLGEQITERGLGNGASLMIFFSIVERFWPGDRRHVPVRERPGAIGLLALIALGFMMVGVVAGVVTITIAARRIAIQIPQRTMARGRMREAARNFIPLRINSAGVMPIIFAQSLIVVPGAIAQFSGNERAQRCSPTTSRRARGCTSCCRRC